MTRSTNLIMLALGGVLWLCLVAPVAFGSSFAVEQRTYVEDFQTKDFRDADTCSKPGELQPRCDSMLAGAVDG